MSESGQWTEQIFEWRLDGDAAKHNQHLKSFLVKACQETTVFCSAAYSDFGSSTAAGPRRHIFSYDLKLLDGEEIRLRGTCAVEIKAKGGKLWSREETFQLTQGQSLSRRAELSQHRSALTVRFTVKFARDGIQHLVDHPMSMGVFGSPLIKETDLGDVVIACQGEQFKCHKIILVGRSEFFRKLLLGHFKEAKQGQVELKDIEPDVLKFVIKFLYEDAVAENEITWDLYEAAKMYYITRLQQLCLRSLRKNLSIYSCPRMLEATFLNSLEDLFAYAMDFFRKHKNQVAQTEGWKEVMSNNELMSKIILHQM